MIIIKISCKVNKNEPKLGRDYKFYTYWEIKRDNIIIERNKENFQEYGDLHYTIHKKIIFRCFTFLLTQNITNNKIIVQSNEKLVVNAINSIEANKKIGYGFKCSKSKRQRNENKFKDKDLYKPVYELAILNNNIIGEYVSEKVSDITKKYPKKKIMVIDPVWINIMEEYSKIKPDKIEMLDTFDNKFYENTKNSKHLSEKQKCIVQRIINKTKRMK